MKRSILAMIAILTFCGIGLIASSAMAADAPPGIDGPLANATVSFGQWVTDPPLDRLLGNPAGGAGNNHELLPNVVTIKAGGAVNFIISGLHNPQVFDDPNHVVNTASPLPGAAGGIINDPVDRVYRGVDPNSTTFSLASRDRVEVVQFTKPGTYLVICGVFNHFVNDDMFGFVRVLPGKGD
jgi:plastocyanin